MVIAQLSKSKAIYNTMVKSPDSGARNPELKSHFYHLIMMRPWTNQSLYLNFFNCKMEVMILPQKITVKIDCINICQKKNKKNLRKMLNIVATAQIPGHASCSLLNRTRYTIDILIALLKANRWILVPFKRQKSKSVCLMEKDECYKFDFFIFRHVWEIMTDREMRLNPAKYHKISQFDYVPN